MTTPGWYRMHRGWLDNEALGGAREPFCRRAAWAWLIEEAFFQDGTKLVGSKTITLQRGQLSASYRFMAKAWNWDEARVRRFIARLIECKMTVCVTDAGQNRITICKYEEYQTSGSVADAPSDAGPTQDRRTGDANYKEGKEGNKGKEDLSDIGLTASPQPKPAEASALIHDNRQLDLVDAVAGTAKVVRVGHDPAEAVVLWNAMAAANGLPQVQRLHDERKRHLQARLRECGGIEGWRIALEKLAASPFHLGQNDRGWRADIDYVLRPGKFAKLMESVPSKRAEPPVSELTGAAMWAAIAAQTKGGHA